MPARPETEVFGFGDRPPLPLPRALAAVGRCAARTLVLLARGRIEQPTGHIGEVLHVGNGVHARVYRETVVKNAAVDDPAALVVEFRLRWVRGWGHSLFRAVSVLNTPLFAGFPGLVSKLWLAQDTTGVYRGIYQWNGAVRADAYARALWWVLALVSERRSIHYLVLPGRHRDDLLPVEATPVGEEAGVGGVRGGGRRRRRRATPRTRRPATRE
jgi:hypothetical protein